MDEAREVQTLNRIHALRAGIKKLKQVNKRLLEIAGVDSYPYKGEQYYYKWHEDEYSNEDYIETFDSELETISCIEISTWAPYKVGCEVIRTEIKKHSERIER